MTLHVDIVLAVLGGHPDRVSAIEASERASPLAESLGPAEAAVEEPARPSSHILCLVAAAGFRSEHWCMVEEVEKLVVPSMVEVLAVVQLASLPT